MLPQTDFITAMFNVHPDEIESLETFKQDTTFHYHIRLNLKKLACPYCSEPSISHGQKEKIIHHPNVIDFDGIIHFYARRYICMECQQTFFETNPFSFVGFNNSYALMDRVMKRLDLLIHKFQTSGIVEYDKFTRMLMHWREEIINSFQRPHNDRKQSNA